MIKDVLESTSRQVDGQWEVGLPFKKDNFIMPDTYDIAWSRQQLLLRKFQVDSSYANRYKLFDSGYARELSDNELSAGLVLAALRGAKSQQT